MKRAKPVVLPSHERFDPWLQAVSPALLATRKPLGPHTGKWCIVRPPAEVDAAWAAVEAAVRADRIPPAKVATAWQASHHGGSHLICAYSLEHRNRADVFRLRQVLREIGYTEPLKYKSDEATRSGIYSGAEEWLYDELRDADPA